MRINAEDLNINLNEIERKNSNTDESDLDYRKHILLPYNHHF